MTSRNPNFCETVTPNKVILETTCPFCGKEQRLIFSGDKMHAYMQGKVAYDAGYRVQAAFPSFTPSEREFILTGICDECWESM